jgi:hypothetical protein
MKAEEIRGMNADEIRAKVAELERERFNLSPGCTPSCARRRSRANAREETEWLRP